MRIIPCTGAAPKAACIICAGIPLHIRVNYPPSSPVPAPCSSEITEAASAKDAVSLALLWARTRHTFGAGDRHGCCSVVRPSRYATMVVPWCRLTAGRVSVVYQTVQIIAGVIASREKLLSLSLLSCFATRCYTPPCDLTGGAYMVLGICHCPKTLSNPRKGRSRRSLAMAAAGALMSISSISVLRAPHQPLLLCPTDGAQQKKQT